MKYHFDPSLRRWPEPSVRDAMTTLQETFDELRAEFTTLSADVSQLRKQLGHIRTVLDSTITAVDNPGLTELVSKLDAIFTHYERTTNGTQDDAKGN